MAGGVRPERVQEAIRQEVSRIIIDELKDPRLGFITVTRVELTKDLRYAKIFFTVLEEAKQKRTLKTLAAAKGYIRSQLGERIKLQFVPDIAFHIDESYAHTKLINDLLAKIEKERIEREKLRSGAGETPVEG